MIGIMYYIFFFFSSRRRHTRCSRDWSSDVCSSDLRKREDRMDGGGAGAGRAGGAGSDTVITNLSTTSTRRVQFADQAPVAACTFPFPQSVWIVDKRRNDVPARNL